MSEHEQRRMGDRLLSRYGRTCSFGEEPPTYEEGDSAFCVDRVSERIWEGEEGEEVG